MLIMKTADFDFHQFRQFLRQVFDMDAGAAVNVRRIFVCYKHYLHCFKPFKNNRRLIYRYSIPF